MNTRTIAGLQLKNSIKNHFNTIPLRVLDYIKQLCMDMVNYPDESCICKTVSSVIAAIISRGQVHNWSSMILLLIEKLQDPVVLQVYNGLFLDVQNTCIYYKRGIVFIKYSCHDLRRLSTRT